MQPTPIPDRPPLYAAVTDLVQAVDKMTIRVGATGYKVDNMLDELRETNRLIREALEPGPAPRDADNGDEDQADEPDDSPFGPIETVEIPADIDDVLTRLAAVLPAPPENFYGSKIPTVFTLPAEPNVGRQVTDKDGDSWERRGDGLWHISANADHPHTGLTWNQFATYFPAILVEWTEADLAEHALYGPPGARWGDPNTPCPYIKFSPATGDELGRCSLGLHHTGGHRDPWGNEIVPVEPDGSTTTAAVTAQDLAEPCTCGHPDAHIAGCARFERSVGRHPGTRPEFHLGRNVPANPDAKFDARSPYAVVPLADPVPGWHFMMRDGHLVAHDPIGGESVPVVPLPPQVTPGSFLRSVLDAMRDVTTVKPMSEEETDEARSTMYSPNEEEPF